MNPNLLPRYAAAIERQKKEAPMKKARFFAMLEVARNLKGYPKEKRILLLRFFHYGYTSCARHIQGVI
ncbi:hypothetical protein ES703_84306 [subsurface metagenome]